MVVLVAQVEMVVLVVEQICSKGVCWDSSSHLKKRREGSARLGAATRERPKDRGSIRNLSTPCFFLKPKRTQKNHRNFSLGFFYFFQALLPCHLEVDRLSVCLVTIYPCLCVFFVNVSYNIFSFCISFFLFFPLWYFSFITLSLSSLPSFPHFFSGSV